MKMLVMRIDKYALNKLAILYIMCYNNIKLKL